MPTSESAEEGILRKLKESDDEPEGLISGFAEVQANFRPKLAAQSEFLSLASLSSKTAQYNLHLDMECKSLQSKKVADIAASLNQDSDMLYRTDTATLQAGKASDPDHGGPDPVGSDDEVSCNEETQPSTSDFPWQYKFTALALAVFLSGKPWV